MPAGWIMMVMALMQTGCGRSPDGRPGRIPVTGTVMMKGQPVVEATVLFVPVGDTPAAVGTTDADGRFRLRTFEPNDGAVAGDYKVAVRKIEVISSETGVDPADALTPPPNEKWLLPPKFGSGDLSGLKATVKPGEKNDFPFELTP